MCKAYQGMGNLIFARGVGKPEVSSFINIFFCSALSVHVCTDGWSNLKALPFMSEWFTKMDFKSPAIFLKVCMKTRVC